MIWSLLFLANMIVTGIPTALLFIPWCWLTGNVLPLYKGTRFMLSSSCRIAGVRLRPEGFDRIPRDRACIFMSNHVSNLDPPALISLIPGRTSAFMKRSLMNLPILGTGFRQGEFIAVDRTGNPSDAQRSVAEAQRVLAKGMHITTFVEGTRSPDGRMLPFKKGPFFLAKASGAPLHSRFRSTERRRFFAREACACIPAPRTSSFMSPSIPQTTPLAKNSRKPSAPPSPPACRSGCAIDRASAILFMNPLTHAA